MYIRLLKSYTHKNKKYPLGQILNVGMALYKALIEKKIAEDYTGERPPKSKLKTEFFKPKIQWH